MRVLNSVYLEWMVWHQVYQRENTAQLNELQKKRRMEDWIVKSTKGSTCKCGARLEI